MFFSCLLEENMTMILYFTFLYIMAYQFLKYNDMIWSKAPQVVLIWTQKCSNYIDHLQEVMLAEIARGGGWSNM